MSLVFNGRDGTFVSPVQRSGVVGLAHQILDRKRFFGALIAGVKEFELFKSKVHELGFTQSVVGIRVVVNEFGVRFENFESLFILG